MENRLKTLFEYQRFAPNAHLSAVIEDALQDSGAAELEDDELLLAAGGLSGKSGQKRGIPGKVKLE